MPFRHAHYWIVALIALTVVGFWPSYFAILPTAPWGFHLHGITATLWLMLLAVQSWSAHARRFPLHRALGKASLGLFPVFLAGGAAVVSSMALATAAGDPFYAIYGARLALMDIAAMVLVGWLYHRALAERRSVQLHARYLLATPLMLISPIMGRVLGHLVPGLIMHGPPEFHLFAWSVRIGNAIALVLAVWLYRRAPRYGRAFAVTAGVIVVQAFLFDAVAFSAAWQRVFAAIASASIVPLLVATGIVGVGIEWLGWRAGTRRARAANGQGLSA